MGQSWVIYERWQCKQNYGESLVLTYLIPQKVTFSNFFICLNSSSTVFLITE